MAPDVILTRHDSTDEGTFGRVVAGDLVLYSAELPWRDNAAGVSCIPEGIYRVRWTLSPRLRRRTYEICQVSGRAGIRVHAANYAGDTARGYRAQVQGCLALGERLGWLDGQKAMLISGPAVRRFESYMGHRPFLLEICHA